MVTKVTFVGPSFTRKPPKYERFIRPTGLRMTKANVTHPELQVCVLQLYGESVGSHHIWHRRRRFSWRY
jgi:ribosomal protein S8E